MRNERQGPQTFWKTVWLLLEAARKRAAGRRKRQQELLQQRAGKSSTDWSGVGYVFSILFMGAINVFAAFLIGIAVESGQRVEVQSHGTIVVSDSFLQVVKGTQQSSSPDQWTETADQVLGPAYSAEAAKIVEHYGGSQSTVEQKLRTAVREHGSNDLISKDEASPGLAALPKSGRFSAMFGCMILIGWLVMLVFQGEGLELDTQRRRHPMWEWLFSHPVQPGAVFLAEMLSPIAANPMYWCAPLCVGVLYGRVYGVNIGILAALVVGVPVTIAAACVGKALEIAVMLRFPMRTRGAVIGLMSWLGYASLMFMLLGLYFVPRLVTAAYGFFTLFAALPWPWLSWFLGARPDGSFSFSAGVFACLLFSALAIAASVRFSAWGAQKGLSGSFGGTDSAPSVSRLRGTRFGKDPLYRKEFLWFTRDRSAIVQSILIPLTVAGFQLFNLRILINKAQGEWNYLCGAAILFGTYFLWVLGPRSLSSEGTALWISLTWPRGMESLLKAKAWLWSLISTGLVALVLCYTALRFPSDILQVLLVGVAWFVFSRSMAEKTVTLVTITSDSGEQQKIPQGRRWAAQLGMLTFAIGVITRQWQLALVGIVYSYITAAAMWQNFRARLPYLYDPWSEELPKPPTLMHAMISISILVEVSAVLSAFVVGFGGRNILAIAQAFGYAVAAIVVCFGVAQFLSERNVELEDVCLWRNSGELEEQPISRRARWAHLSSLGLIGAAGGVALGLFARGYSIVLEHIPALEEVIRTARQQAESIPGLHLSYFIIAVFFAPFAEEYLFRGLLFRALDREWGGWKAVLGSAAFFAIYHPTNSWLPVGLLGIVNALLFKKTRSLVPAVVLHMVYNAVVLS